jgi:hypothetical protein
MVVGCYAIDRGRRPANLEVRVPAGNNAAVFVVSHVRLRPRPRRPRGWSSGALRWLALSALLFATPVIQQALTEAVELLAADDCGCAHDSEPDCKEQGECPGPCQTCFCCPHSNVVSVAGIGMLVRASLRDPIRFEHDGRESEGYLSSPFRPPIG